MMIRKGLEPTLEENPSKRTILHLDLDAFFAQVEEAANPLLRGKPVFVVGHSMTSGIVLTSNYVARKFGVKTGVPLREARRLCPSAVLVPADSSKYSDTAEQIFAHLESYTPLVEIFSIDEAFMDLTAERGPLTAEQSPEAQPKGAAEQSPEAQPKGAAEQSPENIAQEIKRWVWKNFHLTLSAGIAPNKLLAKLASERRKPDGLFRIRPGEVEGILKELPIEELCGIGSRLKLHLNQMGIFTAGELGRFPEMELFNRFGLPGLVLKRMGQGIDHSPVLPADHFDPAKSMGHSYTLVRAARDRETAFRYLLWLSEKTARRLRRRGYEGRTIHTTVRFSDFETRSKQKNLPFFVNDGKTIFGIARKILAEIAQPGRPIPGNTPSDFFVSKWAGSSSSGSPPAAASERGRVTEPSSAATATPGKSRP